MDANARYQNSILALCDGVDTTLHDQPHRPTYSVVRTRRRILFGVQLPSSSTGNAFKDLYDESGTRLTFRSHADVSSHLPCLVRTAR
jgi:hypothetical protein